MRLLVCYGLVLMFVLGWYFMYRRGLYRGGSYRDGSYRGEVDSIMLNRTLDALTKTLQYMQRSVLDLNLDAVFCAKTTQGKIFTQYLKGNILYTTCIIYCLMIIIVKKKDVWRNQYFFLCFHCIQIRSAINIPKYNNSMLLYYEF